MEWNFNTIHLRFVSIYEYLYRYIVMLHIFIVENYFGEIQNISYNPIRAEDIIVRINCKLSVSFCMACVCTGR